MAIFHGTLDSEVLQTETHFTAIIPDKTDKPKAVLYLLHGYSNNDKSWLYKTNISRYVQNMNLAVIMPRMDNSFYSDMHNGFPYFTYLSEEFVPKMHNMFSLAVEKEKNFVAGLSMGGYGAVKWALNDPEKFSLTAMLSAVIDPFETLLSVENQPLEQRKAYASWLFGEESQFVQSRDNLSYLIDSGAKIEELIQICGTEDFLYGQNIAAKDMLAKASEKYLYIEEAGVHEWGFWDRNIQVVLKRIEEKLAR